MGPVSGTFRAPQSSTDIGCPCWAQVTMRTDGFAVDAAGRDGLGASLMLIHEACTPRWGVSRFHHPGQPSTSPPASPSPTRPIAPRPRTPQCRLRALISAPADDRSLGERYCRVRRVEGSDQLLEQARKRAVLVGYCLLYTSPSPRDRTRSRMPS